MPISTPKTSIDYVFSNGVSFSGTIEQVMQYAALLGETINPTRLGGVVPSGYYYSTTRGLLKISDMDTIHLVNALNKRSVDYYNNLRPKTKDFDLKEYLQAYIALVDSPEIEEMYKELSKRKK